MIDRGQFLYSDNSNKLFTKIQLVNTLTQKEMDKLNMKYKELGLFIKQINVDHLGNEIASNEFILDNNLLKRKKRPSMTLREFYTKYYYNNNHHFFHPKNYKNNHDKDKNKQKKKKLLKNKNNEEKGKKNQKNNHKHYSYSSYESESEQKSENYLYDKEELKSLRKNLIEIYEECQNLQYKDCKFNDDSFKIKIIEYIKKFKNFLSDKQYLILYNKWKNELMKIRGVNPFDDGRISDLSFWKVSILKSFKSEVSLLAMSNILGKKVGEMSDNEDSVINKKIVEDKKVNESDEENSEESKEDEDDEFENEQAQILQLKKHANENGEE
jgi:hypothetical protein